MRTPRGATALILCAAALGAPAVNPKKLPLTPEQRAAQSIMKSLSLREKVAQLIMGACYGDAPSSRSAEFQKYQHWVRDLRIGGIIVVNRVDHGLVRYAEPHAMAVFLNRMQRMAKTPLLVASDFERGASMRVSGTTRFPYSMAFAAARDVEASRFEGLMTAREARALGVQWVLAPVADVNNNPGNPVINIRAYSENPEEVAGHVAAYVEGAHSDPRNRVLVTAKHFPGHGDTNINSHLATARLEASRERIEEVELEPFRAAIAKGVDAIMTAHISVPAIEPENIPATVSAKVLTGLLREELEFNGLIITDALDMGGVGLSPGAAAVRAIEAGADVLLMPPDPEQAIRAVVAAVENKRLTRQRVEDSVARVLAAKIHVGLTAKTKLVNLEEISDILESPEAAEQAQQVADHAVTLVRNEGDVVPLKNANASCLVALVERRQSQLGLRIIDEVRKRAPHMRTAVLDASLPETALVGALADASSCEAVVVATFVTASDSRNNVALAGDLGPFVDKLTAGTAPVVLISLGTPYLLASYPKVAAYMATFSIAPPSEAAAVKALFGDIPIGGHLPVSIPGLAAYGEGIQLPPRTQ
jgi:beta-N-acetylhexosaminidase